MFRSSGQSPHPGPELVCAKQCMLHLCVHACMYGGMHGRPSCAEENYLVRARPLDVGQGGTIMVALMGRHVARCMGLKRIQN